MSRGFLVAAVLKDLRRLRRDPWSVASWVGIPLIIGLLLSLAFSGDEDAAPRAHVLVADLDASLLSELLVGALGNERVGLIDAEPVEEADGRRRIDEGEATALLVIPAGFGGAVLRETPIALELVTNPSQRILPGIVEELLSALCDVVFYLHRLLGEEIRPLVADGDAGEAPDDARVAAISVQVNGAVRRLSGYLEPPLLSVAEAPADDEAPTQDLGRLFLPGILVMGLLFVTQGLAGDIWREREQRTLRRTALSPRGAAAILAGKVTASALVILLVCVVAVGIGAARYGIPALSVPLAVAWSVLTGLMLLALQLVVQVHARSSRGAGLLSLAIIFPLMMLGGSFFPFAAMPEWMASIGRFTPNGWALTILEEIAWGSPTVLEVGRGALVLVATTFLLLVLVSRRLTATFVEE